MYEHEREATHKPNLMSASSIGSASGPLQRVIAEREQLFKETLELPLEYRKDLVNKLIWSLPRNEISRLNEQLSGSLQRDIIGSLPPELAFLILSKLGLGDLLGCGLVSKKWRSICEEQSLWALLCASHVPPFRPSHPSWADLSTARSILSKPQPNASDEEEEYDNDRFYDSLSISGGMGGGGGLGPLGMKGGLRRNVWERGSGSAVGTLPTHSQATSASTPSKHLKDISPIPSHLAIPSTKPQVNYRHLYIIHRIIEKRLTSPGPSNNTPAYMPSASTSSGAESGPKPAPRPRTIDAISSVKNGGLPGHSEAIYSLTLIHHEMKINLIQNCTECHQPPLSSSSGNRSDDRNQSVFDSLLTFTSNRSPAGGNANTNALLPGQKRMVKTSTAQGKEWLLSGSRDKTLRLWYLGIGAVEPKVVKVFQGGHSGSVLTHAVVKIPLSPFRSTDSYATSTSPTKGLQKMPLEELEHISANGSQKVRVLAVSGGSDGKICLWDIEGSSYPAKVVQAHSDSVLCVRADERYVLLPSRTDKTIKLFDIATLEEKLAIGPSNGTDDEDNKLHRGAVNAVGLSEQYIISASGDKTIRIWCIHTGQLLLTLEAHTRGIASIDFSSSLTWSLPALNDGERWIGSIVTGASDASIKIFQLIEKDAPTTSPSTLSSTTLHALDGSGMDLDSNPPLVSLNAPSSSRSLDNPGTIYQATTSSGKTLSLIEDIHMFAPCVCPPGLNRPSELISGRCRRCGNRGHIDLVRTVHMGEKVVVSGSYDSKVKVWDRSSGQHLMDLSGAHTGRIFSVISDKYKIISSGLDCRINIWNFAYDLDTSFVRP
uniref:F-box domain-containing protein n=1 Tax=Kwoniella dejecticola CBS 10117 TaxID=1296121 RepID=A0A1A6AE78_9TREE|nr:uncharacterized protein I303_00196 [Kwoniella dejecticola CBS 10117]OBR88381.1 hypothetical protein I303_00196 [Kwoniella dejecticola CBS 10117]